MEHFEGELLEHQTKNRRVLHEHMELLDKLIEYVACLLVFMTTVLLYAFCGSQIAAYAGVALLIAMILWRRRRIRIK
jgi:hypothetical protein